MGQLGAILGAGGMGAVYRAVQQPVGREVALKVIRAGAGDGLGVQRRFELEAEVVARLEHPNTVTLYDFGVQNDGTLYMVLELVRGRPLSAEIQRGPMPYARAAWIIAEVLDALVEAHGLGLVHRDLKPANIMLSQTRWGSEGVRVLDFGIAKAVGGEAAAADQLTQTGMVCGTPRYMAPEQAMGKEIGPWTDLYAMGVVLWTCLTGRPPFEADNTFEILLAHRQQPVPPMAPGLGVPEVLVAVVERALAKAPRDRFPDARGMAEALRTAAGQPGPDVARAAPPGTSPSATRPAAPAALHGAETELGAAGVVNPGKSEGLAAAAAPASRSLRPVAVAAILCLAALAGVGTWLATTRDGERPPPATAAAPAASAPVTREGATTGGAAAAPATVEGHYRAAARHALAGRVGSAVAALEACLALAHDDDALRARLRADADFDGIRGTVVFRSWAQQQAPGETSATRGPAASGKVPEAAAEPAEVTKQRRRPRGARGRKARDRVKPARDPGVAARKGVDMEEF